MKTLENREINPSRISAPSSKIAKISVRKKYAVYSNFVPKLTKAVLQYFTELKQSSNTR